MVASPRVIAIVQARKEYSICSLDEYGAKAAG